MLAFRQTLSRLHANDSELSKISLDDLPLHVISNEELAEFGNLLCHSKHIRKVELDISRFSASGTGCAALQRFFATSTSLEAIVLASTTTETNVSRRDKCQTVDKLLFSISSSRSLKTLDLVGVDFGPRSFAALLQNNCSSTIKELTLFSCNAGVSEPRALDDIARAFHDSSNCPDRHHGGANNSKTTCLSDLYLMNLDNDFLVAVLQQLKHHASLETLVIDVASEAIPVSVATSIRSVLDTTTTLKTLYMKGIDWQQHTFEPIVDGLSSADSTTQIIGFRNCGININATGMRKLWKKMVNHNSRNGSLQGLQLTGGSITDNTSLSMLLPMMHRTMPIKALNLSNNGFVGAKAAAAIQTVLQRNNHLIILRIDGNNLGEDAGRHLGCGLRKNKNLQSLHCDSCHLGDFGVELMATLGISHNSALKALNLGNNNISFVGCIALANALRAPASPVVLQSLDLCANELISNEGAKSLATILEKNAVPSLKKLVISRCGFTDAGLMVIIRALRTNTTLTTLESNDNTFGSSACIALGNSLPHISLKSLALGDFAGLSENSKKALMQGVKMNFSLVHLCLLVGGKHAFGDQKTKETMGFYMVRNSMQQRCSIIGNQNRVLIPHLLHNLNKKEPELATSAIFYALRTRLDVIFSTATPEPEIHEEEEKERIQHLSSRRVNGWKRRRLLGFL